MPILHAPRSHPAEDDDSYPITIRAEAARCATYFFFWTFCLFAKYMTDNYVEPILEGGAAGMGRPPEQYGCPPFNRDQEILGNSPTFNFKFGDGFTIDESHLVEAFGFGNICTLWDYSPSREVTAVYFPFFEYSLVIYLFLDYVVTAIAFKRGLLPRWYLRLAQVVTPICMFLSALFRLIFIAQAFEQTKWHTVGFLGLQVVLVVVAIMNVLYVLMTGQSYPNIGFTEEKTASFAKWYLFLNLAISSVKIYATFYIVFISPIGYSPDFYKLPTPFGDLVLGRVIDLIWMLFNAFLPLFISIVRVREEDPIEISITIPPPTFSGAGTGETAALNN